MSSVPDRENSRLRRARYTVAHTTPILVARTDATVPSRSTVLRRVFVAGQSTEPVAPESSVGRRNYLVGVSDSIVPIYPVAGAAPGLYVRLYYHARPAGNLLADDPFDLGEAANGRVMHAVGAELAQFGDELRRELVRIPPVAIIYDGPG